MDVWSPDSGFGGLSPLPQDSNRNGSTADEREHQPLKKAYIRETNHDPHSDSHCPVLPYVTSDNVLTVINQHSEQFPGSDLINVKSEPEQVNNINSDNSMSSYLTDLETVLSDPIQSASNNHNQVSDSQLVQLSDLDFLNFTEDGDWNVTQEQEQSVNQIEYWLKEHSPFLSDSPVNDTKPADNYYEDLRTDQFDDFLRKRLPGGDSSLRSDFNFTNTRKGNGILPAAISPVPEHQLSSDLEISAECFRSNYSMCYFFYLGRSLI